MDERQHQRHIIEKWMLSNVRTEGFNRDDDLHIDKIGERWRDRKNWIEGGLKALHLGAELRDKHQLQFTVALGCSLLVSDSSPLVVPRSKEDFTAQLDWSPPSLYLFPKGREPWQEWSGTRILEELSGNVNEGRSGQTPQFYYLEFTQSGAKHRSVFVAA